MNTVVGIFNSFADAKRAAAMLRSIGIAENQIGLLSPRTPETEIEANIPTSETEQPGMGTAVGGAVGGALGVAGGMQAGLAVATALGAGRGADICAWTYWRSVIRHRRRSGRRGGRYTHRR